MSEDIAVFTAEDGERISAITPWAEEKMRMGENIDDYPYEPEPNPIFGKLITKDPDGNTGYWEIHEAFNDSQEWFVPDDARKWDDGEFPYVRHAFWEDAEIGQIVLLKTIPDRDIGFEWVFYTNVTNPEAFIFYADDNGGTGQALSNSKWTMKNGGRVLTNVGTADILPGFQISSGDHVQITCTFVDLGQGYELASAVMNIGKGEYWQKQNDGTVIVNHPICEVETIGDIGRFVQHHAGDVHLEIFAFADEPDTPPKRS